MSEIFNNKFWQQLLRVNSLTVSLANFSES